MSHPQDTRRQCTFFSSRLQGNALENVWLMAGEPTLFYCKAWTQEPLCKPSLRCWSVTTYLVALPFSNGEAAKKRHQLSTPTGRLESVDNTRTLGLANPDHNLWKAWLRTKR